jgi:hypothetical protein
MIETSCGNIEDDETGKGTTILLAPGSCSTDAAWRQWLLVDPVLAFMTETAPQRDCRCGSCLMPPVT